MCGKSIGVRMTPNARWSVWMSSRREATAWAKQRNLEQAGVDWQFTTEDARIKLKRLYPQYQAK